MSRVRRVFLLKLLVFVRFVIEIFFNCEYGVN